MTATKQSSTRRSTTRRTTSSQSSGIAKTVRGNPLTSAAVVAGVAAAGAFLWSRREQIGGLANSGVDRLSELKDQQFGSDDSSAQSDFSEQALSLKQTGHKASHPADPTIAQQSKIGSIAY